ncbi:MAG: hypothetical protein IPI21_12775 [Propionivibrio sp.]|nr:hypothetical protein [Propionivibrio sp.]
MAFDTAKFLRLDMGYPGISFGYESWALQTYLDALQEHLPLIKDQYRLRAEQALHAAGETDRETIGQHLTEIEEAAERQIPRFFLSSAIVPVWGQFETFVTDIANYVGRREGNAFFLKDVRAGNFREQAEKYFERALQIPLPWTDGERSRLRCLQEIRNIVAHRNGRLEDISSHEAKRIGKLASEVPGVVIEGEILTVGAEYINEAASLVFNVVGKLNQMIADRYDGPTC